MSDLQIRRRWQVVQDRPLRSVSWADTPQLSAQWVAPRPRRGPSSPRSPA